MRTNERILDLDLAAPSQTLAARLTSMAVALRSLLTALRNRHAVSRLTELDDSLLNDLGLSRAEVHEVLSLAGYADDPSSHLRRLARHRAEQSLRGVRTE